MSKKIKFTISGDASTASDKWAVVHAKNKLCNTRLFRFVRPVQTSTPDPTPDPTPTWTTYNIGSNPTDHIIADVTYTHHGEFRTKTIDKSTTMPLITADENSILLVSYSVDDPNTYYVPDSNVNKTVTKNETLDFPEAYLILRTVTIMCTPKFKQLTSLGNSYKVYWANIPESGNVDPKLLGDGDWSEVVDGSVKLMAHKIWVKIGVSGNANYITVDNGDTNQPLTWHSSSGINLSGEWGAYVVDTAVAGLIKFDYTGGIV